MTFEKDQWVTNGAQDQIFVVELGGTYWKDMLQWASQKAIHLSSDDGAILALATKMAALLPILKQCRRIQEIRNKMLSEGFKQS